MVCRSLKQLRKEVADQLARKAAAKAQASLSAPPPTPAGLYKSEVDIDKSPEFTSKSRPKQIKVQRLIVLILSIIASCMQL